MVRLWASLWELTQVPFLSTRAHTHTHIHTVKSTPAKITFIVGQGISTQSQRLKKTHTHTIVLVSLYVRTFKTKFCYAFFPQRSAVISQVKVFFWQQETSDNRLEGREWPSSVMLMYANIQLSRKHTFQLNSRKHPHIPIYIASVTLNGFLEVVVFKQICWPHKPRNMAWLVTVR